MAKNRASLKKQVREIDRKARAQAKRQRKLERRQQQAEEEVVISQLSQNGATEFTGR